MRSIHHGVCRGIIIEILHALKCKKIDVCEPWAGKGFCNKSWRPYLKELTELYTTKGYMLTVIPCCISICCKMEGRSLGAQLTKSVPLDLCFSPSVP